MNSRIDTFDDDAFIEVITTSDTWKEVAERFGYESTLSSNLKTKVRQRCEALGIDCFEPVKKIPVNQRTKGELFSNSKN